MSEKCPICGADLNDKQPSIFNMLKYTDYECPNCGRFTAPISPFINPFSSMKMMGKGFNKDQLKSYLFYHPSKLQPILCDSEEYTVLIPNEGEAKHYKVYNLTPEMVENWYPKNFAEKIDLILLKLAELSNFVGDYICISNLPSRMFFTVDKASSTVNEGYEKSVQVDFMVKYLVEEKFIIDSKGGDYQLSSKGWERVYELQRTQENNKNVFVSMAFNKDTELTREAIRQGIIGAGYSPEFIDEIIHNHQIMPEMFRLIKESRFLILDISDPNYGAYYEAGYALGLGKEVVISCKESVFNKEYITEEEKKYAKYLKPHFDIAQKQILMWKDYADLTKKLTEWIKAIIG